MDRIIEKIKKLLTMAERGTENEAKVAMLKAQRLAAEYEIDINKLNQEKRDEKIVKAYTDYSAASRWVTDLATVIAHNFRSDIFISNKKIALIGYETDTVLIKNILDFAFKDANKRASKVSNEIRKEKGSASGVKDYYFEGYVTGLEKAYEEQVRSNKKFEVMIVKPREVTEFINNITATFTAYRKRNILNDYDLINKVHGQGVQDGYALGNPKKIEDIENKFISLKLSIESVMCSYCGKTIKKTLYHEIGSDCRCRYCSEIAKFLEIPQTANVENFRSAVEDYYKNYYGCSDSNVT